MKVYLGAALVRDVYLQGRSGCVESAGNVVVVRHLHDPGLLLLLQPNLVQVLFSL